MVLISIYSIFISFKNKYKLSVLKYYKNKQISYFYNIFMILQQLKIPQKEETYDQKKKCT